MPNFLSVRIALTAISPRFAISTVLNMMIPQKIKVLYLLFGYYDVECKLSNRQSD